MSTSKLNITELWVLVGNTAVDPEITPASVFILSSVPNSTPYSHNIRARWVKLRVIRLENLFKMKKILFLVLFGVNGGKRKKGGEKCYKNCLCDTKLIDCHGQGFAEFLVNTEESDITTVTKLDLR